MARRGWLLGLSGVLAAGLVASIAAATPVAANADHTVARWEMNEGTNATTMHDSSGNGIHGQIGSAVQTNWTFDAATGYRWVHTRPNTPPAQPERLVTVSDSRLNPGTDDFAITIRFRTTHSYGNMIQKGQATTVGGYFKWQIPNGRVTCLFRGVGGGGEILTKSVHSGPTPLNDGDWHTVRCERRDNQVVMTVDNDLVRRGTGPTGSISNTYPLTIAGKLNCDQIEVTCDYFAGEIDWVHIESEGNGPPTTTTIPNENPVAVARADCAFLDCDFGANGSYDPDGNITGYSWDFGDGSRSEGFSPNHTYASAGTYTVRLTVTDNNGATDFTTMQVTVAAAPAVHLQNLIPTPFDFDDDSWVARIIVKVRDASGNPVEGVEITAVYGIAKLRTCVTNAAGKCKVKARVQDAKPKIRMEVTEVDWVGGYDPSANRDTDRDGNGETTKVWQPA